MSRWSTRFRRAASLLLGVHLLQAILLAASAVCDRSLRDGAAALEYQAVHGAAHGAMPVATSAHHAHHSVTDAKPADQAPADGSPHHSSHTTSCPMAMACAATAIVAPVPTLASADVSVSDARIGHDALALRSLHVGPETPPPRS